MQEEKFIRYTSDGPVRSSQPPSDEFVMLTWQQMLAYTYFAERQALTFLAYAAIIALCQMMQKRTVDIWPKWYEKAGLNPQCFSRAVRKLEKMGLITVDRPNGKPMRVTLLEVVPLRARAKKPKGSSRP